jgi:hypothetical protein
MEAAAAPLDLSSEDQAKFAKILTNNPAVKIVVLGLRITISNISIEI